MNKVAGPLRSRDILLDVVVAGKSGLLKQIGQHMEWVHGIAQMSVERTLAHREQISSTGLGRGIAIPHARVEDLDRIRVAYLRLKPPIAFDAPDGKPVSDALVMLVPKLATEEHLRILAETSQMFSDPRFRGRLHGCQHPAQVRQLFEAWPRAPGWAAALGQAAVRQ